ncbi:MAG: N-acetylmuramoyl-L-alanine amidase [Bacteroidota bacterium]
MFRLLLLFSGLIFSTQLFAQLHFSAVYSQHPKVPKGLLEAVAHSYTRMQVIDENTQASCMGMPLPYGVMGLFENGQNYFIENGKLVAELSGISIEQQKLQPQDQVLAYAIAFEELMNLQTNLFLSKDKKIYNVLANLSEIPSDSWTNRYAKDAQLFEIFQFLNSAEMASLYHFTAFDYDLKAIFGSENYKVLNSQRVKLTAEGIVNEHNELYKPSTAKSAQYGPAIWTPAPTCNYSSRSGTAVSAITIHTIQGTYAGAISWAQNCSSSVSYHYVIRSSDGQITQLVDEADKAWHVGSENPYTIGYEHDGYVDNPAWLTNALYNASAALSVDITNSGYGIPPLRTYYGAASSGSNVLGSCTKIKGHQHYPNQSHTDPGINWNWEKYYRLINNNPTIQTITSTSGNFYDSGGAAGNYLDDERQMWLFQPTSANSVTLNFSSFNIESGYDKLFIYDGPTITSPLIGVYTGTTSPGIVSSTGGSLLVEFRSDCSTVAAGWAVNYSSISADNVAPTTAINPTDWQTEDFQVGFVDNDNIGVIGKYYLVADKNPTTERWSSNGDFGFANELFTIDDSLWTDVTGNYQPVFGKFTFDDVAEQNSNTYHSVAQDNTTSFLYEWDQTITSTSTSQRAGLHFFSDNPLLPNRGNSYFVFFRETDQKVQIYRVDNDVFSMKTNDACVVTANVEYTYRVTYNPQSGWIKVYVGDLLVSQWQDIEPFQSGNSISLRTGGCTADFDNVRVFRSRGANADVSVGAGAEMRFQSVGAIETGAVRSMVVDEVGNWSTGVSEIFLIDWTNPILSSLNDGQTATDIDTTTSSILYANWSGIDEHSAIDHYEVAIGTLPNLNNILDWSDVNLDNALNHVLSNPIYDQLYTVSLRIVNGAELTSLFVSDGQRLVDFTGVDENGLISISIFPNPSSTSFEINGTNSDMKMQVFDQTGRLVYLGVANEKVTIENWSNGLYKVVISQGNQFVVKQLMVK